MALWVGMNSEFIVIVSLIGTVNYKQFFSIDIMRRNACVGIAQVIVYVLQGLWYRLFISRILPSNASIFFIGNYQITQLARWAPSISLTHARQTWKHTIECVSMAENDLPGFPVWSQLHTVNCMLLEQRLFRLHFDSLNGHQINWFLRLFVKLNDFIRRPENCLNLLIQPVPYRFVLRYTTLSLQFVTIWLMFNIFISINLKIKLHHNKLNHSNISPLEYLVCWFFIWTSK